MSLISLAAEHPVVRATLVEAGWSAVRRRDASSWDRVLRQEGFSVTEPAIEVLEELGGLTLSPPRWAAAAFGSGPIVMDPIMAASGEAARIKQRERELGLVLCPVGEWIVEYVLLVADDSSVFAETTFQVLRVGRNFGEALRVMIVADPAPEPIA
ncbi:MAG TPA: SUKH-3 domain-containing protein [Acidimicrobiales bacterium]|nr:SUKH-3 domain-containing protein [Acidimicrobiales bacterium]